MYYIIIGFLYLFSLLPLWIIYRISDFISFVLRYVVGYRRKVLMKNLTIAFPDKTEKEKKAIIKKFYTNFTDTFLEAIKLLTIKESVLRKRIQFDPAIFNDLFAAGKSCQVHLGHNFNWEWVNVRVTRELKHPFLVVYMPINNKLVDRLFKHFRERTGSIMLSAANMRNEILPYRSKQYMLALVADQNPGNPPRAHWVKFFGRWTPFVTGPEKNARVNDMPVVFARFSKPRRGYYEVETKVAAMHPASMKEGELTLQYVRYLEEVIKKQPECYLWSHNRWKWEIKEEYEDRKIYDDNQNAGV